MYTLPKDILLEHVRDKLIFLTIAHGTNIVTIGRTFILSILSYMMHVNMRRKLTQALALSFILLPLALQPYCALYWICYL